MTEQQVIEVIPSKVREVLSYIDYFIFTKGDNCEVLNFSSINDQQTCVLEVDDKDNPSKIDLGIPGTFDCLFYQQLLISILDNYCEKYGVHLSRVSKLTDNFLYSFYILSSQLRSINIRIETSHDLSKLVNYYNEKVEYYRNNSSDRDRLGGSKK